MLLGFFVKATINGLQNGSISETCEYMDLKLQLLYFILFLSIKTAPVFVLHFKVLK